MANPHQDNGVPWSPKPPTTSTAVNTTNVNFGYNPGTGQNDTGSTNNTGSTSNNQIVDTKVQEEAGEGDYLNQALPGQSDTGGNDGTVTYQDLLDAREDEAYQQSLLQQQQMQNARDFVNKYDSNLAQFTDAQLLDLQSSGLFKHEAEGMLGGVSAYEQQVNLLKRSIQDKMDRLADQGLSVEGIQSLPEYQELAKLYGNIGGAETMLANIMSEGTGYDKTGIYTHADVESSPQLSEAYQALTGGDLTADELRQYLPLIDYRTPFNNEGDGFTPTRNILDDRKAWQRQLYYGPKQSPQRAMEQQGFFDTMENAYAADTADTLKKGLYSQSFVHPGAGVMPWGMEKIWATGRAKGGIVSLVGE
jgi:hypothetical protein